MANIRYDITFSGRVQGVGFRYTADQIARRFNIAGWIRNDEGGTVHCVVEGEPDELDAFTNAVKTSMDAFVHKTAVERREATGEFNGFQIRT